MTAESLPHDHSPPARRVRHLHAVPDAPETPPRPTRSPPVVEPERAPLAVTDWLAISLVVFVVGAGAALLVGELVDATLALALYAAAIVRCVAGTVRSTREWSP